MTTLVPQTVVRDPGPFSLGPRKIVGALCEDSKQRVAVCSPLGADTFFSIPARVSARGKTVSGYVTTDSLCPECLRPNSDGCSRGCRLTDDFSSRVDVYLFRAYRYGKNAGAILEHAEPTPPIYSPPLSAEVIEAARQLAATLIRGSETGYRDDYPALYRAVRAGLNRPAVCNVESPTLDDESISEGIVRAINAADSASRISA